MISTEKVGKRIAVLRKQKKLSQEQLAEQLNVSAQAVSKWETGKSLPETATLPLLSSVLGHPIDGILLPQELVVLSAIYTDGNEIHDVTHYVNQFVAGNRLTLTVSDHTFPAYLSSDRTKVLLVHYETPAGIYSTYVLKDQLLSIDVHSKGHTSGKSGLEFVYASYGNELTCRDVLKKMKHYDFFQWEHFTASHELFPSLIDNEGNDYLLLLYLNTEGLHALSCAEGEQIHYSPDRTRLYRTEPPDSHYIVENVGKLGFGRGMDCSWAGALYSSLEAQGVKTSYEQVMGVSGACWRIAFTPVWDYSSVDALVAYDYSGPACTAYGLAATWANWLTPEERKLEKQELMNSIRKHQLPIAINLRVAPEWGVITGYLDDGNSLLCRSYFDEETFVELEDDPEFRSEMTITKGYLYVDQWPYRVMRFDSQAEAPSELYNFYASLRVKLDSMKAAENKGYQLGYKALDLWREGLLDDLWYLNAESSDFRRRFGVNHFCMMALTDARRSAAGYLKASLTLLQNPDEASALAEMAGVYEQIHALLESFYKGMANPGSIEMGAPSRLLWTEEQRNQQAELLQAVSILEHHGDELAEKILGNHRRNAES